MTQPDPPPAPPPPKHWEPAKSPELDEYRRRVEQAVRTFMNSRKGRKRPECVR